MKAEQGDRQAEVDVAFEQSLFVHDRSLWKHVFNPDPEEIEDDGYISPSQDPEEFRDLMDELREMGILAE